MQQRKAGFRVGQFILERQLGEGGMAEVWLGRHVHLGSLAAVKFLNDQYALRKDVEERFLNEGRRQGALDHPNIVKVYGFEYAEGRSFLIMQFVDGEALDQRLHRTGPLNLAAALPIADGLLRALEFAHSRQIVHRDVKPSNILIDAQGTPYLGDFGIVLAVNEKRLTQTGTVMGTPHYMSPEQIARPLEVDQRSDIYSFGCVLYEMLTGAAPFGHLILSGGDPEFAIKMAHLQALPPSPRQRNGAIPDAVAQAILRCLSKDPAQRYSSSGELRAALLQAVGGFGVQPPPVPPPPTRRPWLGIAALALTIGGAAFWPKQPAVTTFAAAPPRIVAGQSTRLTWDVKNAREVEISGLGKQSSSGAVYVKPNGNTSYSIIARNLWRRDEREVAIAVTEQVAIRRYELTPAAVRANETATLTWEVTGATAVTIGGKPMNHTGSSAVHVDQTSTFTIRATGPDGTVKTDVRKLEILPSNAPRSTTAAPEILTLRFTPNVVYSGGSSELFWEVRGATAVQLGDRRVDLRGRMQLNRLDKSLTVTLTATNATGLRATRIAELRVVPVSTPRPADTQLQVRTFRAENRVANGGPYVNIHYDVPGAVRIIIQPEAGSVSAPSGIVSVFPAQSTRYTLTAYTANGTSTTSTLDVVPVQRAPRPAELAVTTAWPVQHHHYGANPLFCSGVIFVRGRYLVFQSESANDGFSIPFGDVTEVKANRYVLGSNNAFHVKSATRNYNFVPRDNVDRVVAEINRAIRR